PKGSVPRARRGQTHAPFPMTESLKEIAEKSGKAKLKYKGKEIIMLEDLAIGLNKSPRTFRRLRAEKKISYWSSKDGHTVFVTQDQFDDYITNNFVPNEIEDESTAPQR
uniref:hypothetical protein n=1 Tax=uncultured Muribaculum sp. TaxID=1918613 RepID=UPI0025B56E31